MRNGPEVSFAVARPPRKAQMRSFERIESPIRVYGITENATGKAGYKSRTSPDTGHCHAGGLTFHSFS